MMTLGMVHKLGIAFTALYDEDARFKVMNRLGMCDDMPDEEYVKRQYKAIMGKELNLDNPRTFNEKLQWLKLHNRRPEYTTMVDKYAVKKYVADKIGEEYIIPTLGVWDSFDDIDFASLPKKFVLKTTHDSGGVIICKDKSKFNINDARTKIEDSLKRNFYITGREWPYKDVKPKIIAEAYLENNDYSQLIEYKIFCFNGEPQYVLVCKGEAHGGNRTNDLYDLEFNHIPLVLTYPNTKEFDSKPQQFDDILYCSRVVSKGIPQLRVDWYIVNNKPYFGEATFFHDCGYCIFKPEKWDEELGKLIDLSGVK